MTLPAALQARLAKRGIIGNKQGIDSFSNDFIL